MNTHSCEKSDLVRDYAFDELAPPERKSLEQHLTGCSDCAAELDRLRLTTAVLRVIPDQEVPRRIAFVSDAPPARRWFVPNLGFASACVLAAAISFSAYRFTAFSNAAPAAPVAPVTQTAQLSQSQIEQAVTKAVSDAVAKTHADDVQMTDAALKAVESKYAQQQNQVMVAAQEYLDLQKKQLHTYNTLYNSDTRPGVSQ